MTDDVTAPPANPVTTLKRRIAGLRMAARAALLVERLTVAALPALGVVSLYLAFSWLGLFRIMPDLVKLAVLAVLALMFGAALLRFRTFTLPTQADGNRRLEDRSGLSHQAISVQAEEPVSQDAFAQTLWRVHQTRMAEQIKAIDFGAPSPDIARQDPFALRAVLILLLVIGWSFSWSNYGGRISDGFTLAAPVLPQSDLRIDAWVTPPTYTGVAPVYLTGTKAKLAKSGISIPQSSELTVRISGENPDAPVRFLPSSGKAALDLLAEKPDPKNATATAAKATSRTYKLKLDQDGTVSIAGKEYALSIIPDITPKISFSKEPGRAVNGALEIAFAVKDDYGVTEANAEIIPAETDESAIPLFAPPTFRLDLPGSDGKDAKSTVSRDLTEHPLSGKKVKLTLVAKDAAGQIGRSETKVIILPARIFNEPLAGSVAEQRQVFSLDVNKVGRALELNDAATFRAEETIPNATHFLLLKSAKNRLRLARSIETLEETAGYFWDIARYIEDGDLSAAEKKVRDAQDKLSEALKRNAPDEEVAKLMQELRQAMKEYLAEMAKRMQNADKSQMANKAQRMMRAQDFENMLNQLENLARSGSREEAQKLLSEMQRMMNNMQTARPRNNQNQQPSPMREQIDKLGELMQKQQKLMEDTHSKEQTLRDRMQRGDLNDEEQQGQTDPLDPQTGEQKPEDQKPGDQQAGEPKPQDQMTEQELRDALKQLKAQQDQLKKDLEALEKGLADMGVKPSPGFKDAGKEMGDSADALGKSQGQRSADAQGRALDALRKGAGELMKQLQQAGREGQPGMPMPGDQAEGNDPLGRKPGQQLGDNLDDQVKVPDQVDVQRAREILDQIRRKLGDGPASLIEKQYLERLLDLR